MATTINMANIGIGLDLSKLKEMGFVRSEINSLRKTINQAEPDSEKYARALELVNKANKAGGISDAQRANALDHLAKKYNQVTIEAKLAAMVQGGMPALSDAISSSFSGMGQQIVGLAAGYASLNTAVQFATTSLKLASEFEQTKIQFQVLTGSGKDTEKLLADFRRLDRESPLAQAAFERAAKTLLGYGMTAKSVTPMLESLSQISMGNEDRLQSLALAMGQVTANGRLMGQEVLQMVNAGFNPLQQISEDTGLSMVTLKKMMEDGQISAEMVTRAMVNATSEGGRFQGMNAQLAETVGGKYAKLTSDVSLFQRTMGQMTLGEMEPLLDVVLATNAAFTTLGQSVSDLVGKTEQLQNSNSYIDKAKGSWNEIAFKSLPVIGSMYGAIAATSSDISNQEDKIRKTKDAQKGVDQERLKAAQDLADKYTKQGEALQYQLDTLILGVKEAERIQSEREGGDFNSRMSIKQQEAELEYHKELLKLKDELKKAEGVAESDIQAQHDLKAGLTQQQVDQLRAMREQVEEAKKLKRVEEEQAKELEKREKAKEDAHAKEMQRLKKEANAEIIAKEKADAEDAKQAEKRFMDDIKRANDIGNAMADPVDKIAADVADAQALFAGGFLDKETLDKFALQSAGKQMSATDPNNVGDIAPALKSGTVEAYKFIAQQNEKSARAAEQVKLAQEILAEAKKANQMNQKAPRLAMAGGN